MLRELQELKLEEMVEIIRNQKNIPEYQLMPFEERLTHVIHAFYEIKMSNRNIRYLKGAKLK